VVVDLLHRKVDVLLGLTVGRVPRDLSDLVDPEWIAFEGGRSVEVHRPSLLEYEIKVVFGGEDELAQFPIERMDLENLVSKLRIYRDLWAERHLPLVMDDDLRPRVRVSLPIHSSYLFL
jgi:hypothetical protein